MRHKTFGAAAILALAMTVAGASAQTITMKSQVDGDVFAGFGSQTVSMTGVPGRGNVSALAGAFRVTDSARNFLAWCVDAAVNLSLPPQGTQYSMTETPFGNNQTLSAAVVGNIQRLFDTAYRDLNVNDNVAAAGFQMALWQIIYEDVPAFSASSNSSVQSAATAFLNGLDGPATSRFELTFWEAATGSDHKRLSQNLLEATVIPLPAGAWMLLAALGALVAAGRARNTA